MTFLLRNAEMIACAILFLAMTALGFANVVVRYTTSYSLAASEELLTNGFLLLTIFGAAIAARRGEHLAVTLFYDMLPRSLRRVALVLSGGLSLFLLLVSAWLCLEMVQTQMSNGMRSYALQVPAWYYTVAMPLGFLLIALRLGEHLVGEWREIAHEGAMTGAAGTTAGTNGNDRQGDNRHG